MEEVGRKEVSRFALRECKTFERVPLNRYVLLYFPGRKAFCAPSYETINWGERNRFVSFRFRVYT